MHRRDQREFDAFVRAVGDRLLHTAELLTGDPVRAERRVNRALARTYLKWRHSAEPDPTRIAHRALVAGYLDPWRPLPWRPQPVRRAGRRGGSGTTGPAGGWAGVAPGAGVGASVTSPDDSGACTDAEAEQARDEVLRGLDGLTRLERAVTVLRAYARLDEFDTAEALAVREATVRSAYARAAERLAAAGFAAGAGRAGAGAGAGAGSGAVAGGGAERPRAHVAAVTWTAGVGVTHGDSASSGLPDSSAPLGGSGAGNVANATNAAAPSASSIPPPASAASGGPTAQGSVPAASAPRGTAGGAYPTESPETYA